MDALTMFSTVTGQHVEMSTRHCFTMRMTESTKHQLSSFSREAWDTAWRALAFNYQPGVSADEARSLAICLCEAVATNTEGRSAAPAQLEKELETLYDNAGQGSTSTSMESFYIDMVQRALLLCHQYLTSAVVASRTRQTF